MLFPLVLVASFAFAEKQSILLNENYLSTGVSLNYQNNQLALGKTGKFRTFLNKNRETVRVSHCFLSLAVTAQSTSSTNYGTLAIRAADTTFSSKEYTNVLKSITKQLILNLDSLDTPIKSVDFDVDASGIAFIISDVVLDCNDQKGDTNTTTEETPRKEQTPRRNETTRTPTERRVNLDKPVADTAVQIPDKFKFILHNNQNSCFIGTPYMP
jgi:hypothetical protein